MKKIAILLFSAVCILAMSANVQAQTAYGKKFEAKNTVKAEDVSKTMGTKTSVDPIVVTGTIAQVCQAEGCWLKMKNSNGADILVKFKDHSFVIPKNLAGKKVTAYGKAEKKVISVEEQKHMAEDAGTSPSDMAAITAPKEELRIEATGIVIE